MPVRDARAGIGCAAAAWAMTQRGMPAGRWRQDGVSGARAVHAELCWCQCAANYTRRCFAALARLQTNETHCFFYDKLPPSQPLPHDYANEYTKMRTGEQGSTGLGGGAALASSRACNNVACQLGCRGGAAGWTSKCGMCARPACGMRQWAAAGLRSCAASATVPTPRS